MATVPTQPCSPPPSPRLALRACELTTLVLILPFPGPRPWLDHNLLVKRNLTGHHTQLPFHHLNPLYSCPTSSRAGFAWTLPAAENSLFPKLPDSQLSPHPSLTYTPLSPGSAPLCGQLHTCPTTTLLLQPLEPSPNPANFFPLLTRLPGIFHSTGRLCRLPAVQILP